MFFLRFQAQWRNILLIVYKTHKISIVEIEKSNIYDLIPDGRRRGYHQLKRRSYIRDDYFQAYQMIKT